MNEHLTREELELLSKRESPAIGLFKALEHLETCKKCRSEVRLPTKEEILKRFELDEEEKEFLSSQSPVLSRPHKK